MFWNTVHTRAQARSGARVPSVRAGGRDGCYPNVPVFFAASRKLAEEWVYRFLTAAQMWAGSEESAVERTGIGTAETAGAVSVPEPTTAELRAWAREHGLQVPGRGRLRPEIRQAWHSAQQAR
ncbi:Lsr2 family DNA-binding protein [Streptomyces cellulosae]